MPVQFFDRFHDLSIKARDYDTWQPVPIPVLLTQVIRGAILNALAYTDGHQGKAAKLLGLTERVMCYQMARLGVPTARASRRRGSSTKVRRLRMKPEKKKGT